MKEEIKVPTMGESITEAIIGLILKPSGSQVEAEDELLELETDKVNQVLYAPASGVVTWNVNIDDTVSIGQVIGVVETEGKSQSVKEPEQPVREPEPEKPIRQPEPEKPVRPQEPEQPVREPEPEKPIRQPEPEKPVKPQEPEQPVKGEARLSKEAAVEEVRAKKPQVQLPKSSLDRGETRMRMPKIRKLIAKRLVEVQQNTAMLTTFNEVDLSEVIAVREKHKESFFKEHGVKLGFMSFFVKGVVSALKAIPQINAYIDGDEIVQRHDFAIGIAVGTERGLIVPVVRDCDLLTFAGIEQAIVSFAAKAREAKISVDDLQGGGFTLTNGGVYGSLLSTPILNPPQSGILGMHKILNRPIAVGDQVAIRPMMYVALSYDHRIVDGKEAVTFLVHLKNHLEDPSQLLLDT